MKKNYSRPIIFSRKSLVKWVPVLIIGGVFFLVLLGTFLAVWQSQHSQDLRQQASVEGGLVEIQLTTEPASLMAGVPTQLHFSVNTHQVLVDGVQLFMKLDMPTVPPTDEVTIEIDDNTGLKLAASKVQTVDNTLQIQLIAISSQTAQPFSTAEMIRFVTIGFVPPSSGQLYIEFDNTLSKSTVYQSDPIKDELATLVPVTLSISDAQDVTITPTSTSSPTDSQEEDTASDKSCNQDCRDHDECEVDLFCHHNKCRSPYHPDSTTCSAPADQGLSKSCNEYCADNRECQTGLTCYYNRCRHPQNVFSEQCSVASPTPTKTVGRGGTTATPLPSPTSTTTPNSTVQPTVTSSEYLRNLDSQNEVNNVFNTFGVSPSVTPRSQAQPLPTAPTDSNSENTDQDSELDPNQKLFFLVAGVGGALLLILLLPLLFALLTRKKPAVKPINGGLEKLITTASQPPAPSAQDTQDLMRFAGSVEARKPKEEEKEKLLS